MYIEDVLANSPHLALVRTNVYAIPERVREYDSTMFVVWNSERGKFEIHSTSNKGNTYCMTIPYDELDSRTIELIRKNDIYNRGEEIFREIDEHNENLEKKNQREFHNWVEDVAKETRWHFKKAFL